MKKRPSIVIVGGGTAGWITLSYLAATVDADLTIIHSNEVDPIGVGESTTPTIKHVADTCGINEREWMRDARATFKYGIEFVDFNQAGSRWFHTFDDLVPGQTFHTPVTEFGKQIFAKETSSVEYFLWMRAQGRAGYDINWYNRSHGGSEFLLRQQRTPFDQQLTANFNRFPGYSYHINAFEFGNSLKKHTPADRYTEIHDHVTGVEYDEHGVKNLVFKDGTKITADLYVDCSGFRRLLIGDLGEFKPYPGLLNNAAVWGPVRQQQVYRPSTLSVAQPHGWIWETPTQGQIGSGYVFCDDCITAEQAENHLRQHWKKQGLDWDPLKSVKFTSGRLQNVAVKNVVANGLGQSFIEPLEATAIMVTCVTAKNLSRIWNKHQGWNRSSSEILSKIMGGFLDETMDFVLAHYTLSDRRDTEYWRSYDREHVVEKTSKMIQSKLQKEWMRTGETNLNGFNWTSMLIGYDKPYLGPLPSLKEWQVKNYEFYTQQLVANYEHLYANNVTIRDFLESLKKS